MTQQVALRPSSVAPAEDAVVTVMKGAVGAHVGLHYRADHGGSRRHLHLAFHFLLKDESAPPAESHWVVPSLDELALADLRSSARLIARRHADGLVPYAFQKADATFERTGALTLNASRGLTCATFLSLVFQHAGISLLDEPTWDHGRSALRIEEDKAAQELLVSYLRRTPGATDHAALVEREVGCARVRAEEVAAASGMTHHPVSFARAEPEGRRLLDALRAP